MFLALTKKNSRRSMYFSSGYHWILLVTGMLIASSLQVFPQGNLTKNDYKRAVGFLWENVNNKKAFNLDIQTTFLPDSTGCWYVSHCKNGKQFEKIIFSDMRKTELFDHQRLADTLSGRLGRKVGRDNLPVQSVKVLAKDSIQFKLDGEIFVMDLNKYRLYEKKVKKAANAFESKSPDGKWIAYIEKFNLFIRSTQTHEKYQLSSNGRKNYEYGSYYGWYDIMKGENGERPGRFRVSWSPDSRFIQTYICDLRSARKMFLLDWSIDSLYRPELRSYYRGSPGDTGMVYMIPVFFDVDKKYGFNMDLPRTTHINMVSFNWSRNPGIIYANYMDRGFQKTHLLKIDLFQKTRQVLYEESSKTNIDQFNYRMAEKWGKILFTSERSGWKQLYTIDIQSGKIEPLTSGNFYVNQIKWIDEARKEVYFSASGKEKGENPYYEHLYRISLYRRKLRALTPENANHQIEITPRGKFFIDHYSTSQVPTKIVLRDLRTGKILLRISEADISGLQAMKWNPPEIFTAMARDGETKIYGAIWKPTNFDPSKKYPVIDHSYTGPHTHMFPTNFTRVLSMNNQPLSELGFIIVMIDGLGTSGRSKAFHNYSYRNMGRNLEDHVLAIRQLGVKYPWIDTSRVGIYGHSAGAYDAAHAMLQYPDFYKVAVASSGDHDFRMEKAWWPEMYMGWPVDSLYNEVSNVTMAPNLKGKLLLVHGGIDENVNPSATFKLAEALEKSDKDFDMLILPSQHHGYQGERQKYFTKKKWNYFIKNLLNEESIWDFDWQ